MPAYFGHAVTQRGERKIEVSDALKQLGINLLRASPSQVVCDVLPYVTSPLWSFFIASLSALMLSLSLETPISLNLTGFRIDTKHPRPLPWFLPRVSIEVKNKGPKQLEWLLDAGFEEQEIRGKSYFICEDPTSDSLRPLLDGTSTVDFNDRNYVPLRTTNISSLLILSEMYNTLSYLTQLLTIPLFEDLPSRSALTETLSTEVNTLLRNAMDVDDNATGAPPPPKSVTSGIATILRFFSDLTDFSNGPSAKETVTAAQAGPNHSYLSINALLRTHDNKSGLFLRFVPDLSDEDSTGVVSFFSRYIRRSLGENTEDIFTRIDEYRSAWGILKSTEAGHVLSHLVKCLEISFDACCAVVPIFCDGYYEGCALVGNGFSLNFRTELFRSLSPEDFVSDLKAVETNSKLANQIHTMLTNADVTIKNAANILKPSGLRDLVLTGSFDDVGRKQLLTLIRKVRFPYKKWSISLGSILRFLDLLTKSLDDLDVETPVGPEAMFSTDPVEVLMSCFKPGACPSFRHPSGVPIDLSHRKAPGPPQDSSSKKGKGPQQVNNGGWVFSIRRVDFTEAVSDFRILLREKEARSLGSAASRGLGHFVLSGGNFERVFMALKEVMGSLDPSSVAEKTQDDDLGVKRGRTDGFDDSRVKQKRRVML
jgi:hypothetical protein